MCRLNSFCWKREFIFTIWRVACLHENIQPTKITNTYQKKTRHKQEFHWRKTMKKTKHNNSSMDQRLWPCFNWKKRGWPRLAGTSEESSGSELLSLLSFTYLDWMQWDNFCLKIHSFSYLALLELYFLHSTSNQQPFLLLVNTWKLPNINMN